MTMLRRTAAVWGMTLALGALVACGHGSTTPPFVESAIVACVQVRDASGSPAPDAFVVIDAMNQGKPGGEYGCTGTYLVGNWSFVTGPDGRFARKLDLRSDGAPVCVILRAVGAGDTAWRDTSFVVRPFTRVASGVAPDTVRFDLRVR